MWVKEGEEPEWERIRKLLPEPGFKVLPRRWVVKRPFFLDRLKRPNEQGLREAVRDERGFAT